MDIKLLLKYTLLVFSLSFFPGIAATQQSNLVIGYYMSWTRSTYPPQMIRCNYLTHVNHAFVWPAVDGTIQTSGNIPDPNLVQTVHKAGKKILISAGGAGNYEGFAAVMAHPEIRKIFINALTGFVHANGYDGADIDWEGPGTGAERDSLVIFMRDLRAAFNAIDSSYLVTMAIPIGDWSGRWYNYTALLPSVDWFNAMAYDFHGSWSTTAGHNAPLFSPDPSLDSDGSVDDGIRYLRDQRKIPTDKLVMGLPFYGKDFTAPYLYGKRTGSVTEVLYSSIPLFYSNWTYNWDNVSQVPYLIDPAHTHVVTFDDTLSILIKCRYSKINKLAGVMMWALGQDVVGQDQPLLRTIGTDMLPADSSAGQNSVALHDFELIGNFPNPFNTSTQIKFRVNVPTFITLQVYDVLGVKLKNLWTNNYHPEVTR